MSADRAIIEAIQKISGTQLTDKVSLFSAIVDSVDEDARTCIVTTLNSQGEITLENVQLMASVDDGLLLIPALDSTVVVAYSTMNQPFIAQYSSLEKAVLIVGDNNVSLEITNAEILLEIANTKLSLIDGKTKFNDGNLGGLVKVNDILTKLNNLENKVNTIISTFNSHTHLGVTTGAGTSGTSPTPITGTLTPTTKSEIENDKIIQ